MPSNNELPNSGNMRDMGGDEHLRDFPPPELLPGYSLMGTQDGARWQDMSDEMHNELVEG